MIFISEEKKMKITKAKTFGVLLVSLIVGSVIYIVVSQIVYTKKTDLFVAKKNDMKHNEITIFPDLDNKFVDQIAEKDQSGNIILNEKLATKLISSVLKRVNEYNGDILFDYEINLDNNSMTLYFKHVDNNETKEVKNYIITI